jgi:hypothetical protein
MGVAEYEQLAFAFEFDAQLVDLIAALHERRYTEHGPARLLRDLLLAGMTQDALIPAAALCAGLDDADIVSNLTCARFDDLGPDDWVELDRPKETM